MAAAGAAAAAAALPACLVENDFFAEVLDAGVLELRSRLDDEGLASLSRLDGGAALRGVVGATEAAAAEAVASEANMLLSRGASEGAAAFFRELDLAAAAWGAAAAELAAVRALSS